MKKLIMLIVIFTGLNFQNAMSISSDTISTKEKDLNRYAQNVHMYIAVEALNLLKDRFPNYDFTVFDQRIGTMDDVGTRAWQTGKITTGTYREDEEDVVFDIRGPFGWYASNSHFWHADDRTNGDNSLTYLNSIGYFPNAYTKVNRYLDGNWFQWNGNGYGSRVYINYVSGITIHRYSYHTRGLTELYKTNRIWHHSYVNLLGQEIIVDQEITISDNLTKLIVFESLGRIAHLLMDMTVPAHAHNDVHVTGDCYHDYIDNGGYQNFNWQTAKNTGGFINPYSNVDDPIRGLVYTANQLADHFPSGPDCMEIPQQHFGDNNLPGGTYPMIDSYYQQLGMSPPNIENVYLEGAFCFNHAIRATAGLYYWFGVETGIFPPDTGVAPVIHGFNRNYADNNFYRGETFRLSCVATGTNLNYEWFFKICDTNSTCTIPVQGLIFSDSNSILKIKNDRFYNSWSCTFYDSLCNSFQRTKNNLLEESLNLFVGVTVSNQFGQDTKYFGMNRAERIYPRGFIRPPDPPITGCPVLFEQTADGYDANNNVLHKSAFPVNLGKDVIDKILIKKVFKDSTDNTLNFAITETAGDVDHFDYIKLVSIIHPDNYLPSVTENNDIVLIRKDKILSPVYADINGRNVTQELKYDSAFSDGVKGNEKDIINLIYKPGGSGNLLQDLKNEFKDNDIHINSDIMFDSLSIILDPEADVINLQTYKKPPGFISIFDSAGIKLTEDFDFTRRVRRSMTNLTVPLNSYFTNVQMVFKEGFDLSYCAIAELIYGIKETEHQLLYAENSSTGEVTKHLLKEDNVKTVIDSSSFLTLKFKHGEGFLREGWKRDFILIFKGRTVQPEVDNVTENHGMLWSENKISNNIPDEFRLQQNYPNPFNPVTNIEFSIPEKGYITLIVFDILGNEVASLVNEVLKPGYYKAKFSANSENRNLASGVYFYRMTAKVKAGSYDMTKRMVLLK